MKKTVLTFGLISGALSSLMMVATVPFLHNIGLNKGLVIGYTAIVLSFLLVFFGIRSYRDNVGNGQITFTKAFAVGISITLISCLFYVGTWEILYFNFLPPDFMDKYGAQRIEKLKASGASPAVIWKFCCWSLIGIKRICDHRHYSKLGQHGLLRLAACHAVYLMTRGDQPW